MRVQHRQAEPAEFRQQRLDVVDRRPAGVAARRRVFLDRLPVGQPPGSDGAVLDVDDQQRRTAAAAAGAAETRGLVSTLLLLGDDAAPRAHDGLQPRRYKGETSVDSYRAAPGIVKLQGITARQRQGAAWG